MTVTTINYLQTYQYLKEERAAILEFDAGFSRAEAEDRANIEMIINYRLCKNDKPEEPSRIKLREFLIKTRGL